MSPAQAESLLRFGLDVAHVAFQERPLRHEQAAVIGCAVDVGRKPAVM